LYETEEIQYFLTSENTHLDVRKWRELFELIRGVVDSCVEDSDRGRKWQFWFS